MKAHGASTGIRHSFGLNVEVWRKQGFEEQNSRTFGCIVLAHWPAAAPSLRLGPFGRPVRCVGERGND
jgi:hypothetical protein